MSNPLLPAEGILPGLVVNCLGQISIVESVKRDDDTATVTLMLNSAQFDALYITIDSRSLVEVLGTSFDLSPDSIMLFGD